MPKTEVESSGGATKPPVSERPGALIGRRQELEEMRAALGEATSGSGRLLLLSGEMGVGKTRLAEELARESQAHRTRLAWGRCWEGVGAPTYWPWVQIIREVARDLSFSGSPEISVAAGYIAEMIPELRPALPAPDSTRETHRMGSVPAALDRPEQGRFQLFDSMSVLLRAAAAVDPLLLIVDDLHAADSDSLLFLKFLARDLPHSRILVVGTYREFEVRHSAQKDELLGQIIREARCFPLRGLGRTEIEEFIERFLGFVVDEALLESLAKTTEGSPFFLGEIVRLMKVEGRFQLKGSREVRFTIPDGIRSVVRRGLAPLSDNAKLALTLASVIGYEFEFAMLQRTGKLARAQLVKSLDHALELGLVIEAHAGHYRFSHAITPEVLRAEISRQRLRELHQRVAEAIEELHHGDLDAHAAAVALHYQQALFPADRSARPTVLAQRRRKIADYAKRGAERSLKQLAYSEAAKLYQLAFDALATSTANRLQQGEVLLGMGEALRKEGNWPEAKQAFARATSLARDLGNSDLLARAALASDTWSATLFGADVDAEMVALLQEALAAVGDVDSGVRAVLLARIAKELAGSGNRDHSLALCEQAIEVARRVDDTGALVSALWTQHLLLWGPHDVEKRLKAASEIVHLAEKAGALDWALSAREFRLSALIELGRIDLADREIEAYAVVQERAGQSNGTIERYRAMRCLMRGEFDRAERYARDLIRIAQRRQDQPLFTAFGTLMIQIRTEQGHAAENEHMISDYAVQFPSLAIARCGLADVYAAEGRESEARQEFERFAADDFKGIPPDCNWICSLTTLCGVCIFLGDEPRAATLYDLLRPYHQRNVTIGWADVSYGSLERYLGRLAALMKRYEEAEAHFVTALRFEHQMEAPAFIAHTRYEYGSMLLRRGCEGDREEARVLLRQALDTASGLGMKVLESRAQGLIGATGSGTAAPLASIGNVSASALAEHGRAIATFLFTDVVGSTQRAAELKDHRWVELLEQLHQALRKEVLEFGGREINTAGDGMLAVFNDPKPAIRCAFAIAASALQLGLHVRAGVHTGECEFVGDNVAGIAVHIGARVAARAGAGEVLVSSTVRDLLTGGEMTFGERGVTTLKGVPGEWRLYSVERTGRR